MAWSGKTQKQFQPELSTHVILPRGSLQRVGLDVIWATKWGDYNCRCWCLGSFVTHNSTRVQQGGHVDAVHSVEGRTALRGRAFEKINGTDCGHSMAWPDYPLCLEWIWCVSSVDVVATSGGLCGRRWRKRHSMECESGRSHILWTTALVYLSIDSAIASSWRGDSQSLPLMKPQVMVQDTGISPISRHAFLRSFSRCHQPHDHLGQLQLYRASVCNGLSHLVVSVIVHDSCVSAEELGKKNSNTHFKDFGEEDTFAVWRHTQQYTDNHLDKAQKFHVLPSLVSPFVSNDLCICVFGDCGPAFRVDSGDVVWMSSSLRQLSYCLYSKWHICRAVVWRESQRKNTQLKTYNKLNVFQSVRIIAIPVQVPHHILRLHSLFAHADVIVMMDVRPCVDQVCSHPLAERSLRMVFFLLTAAPSRCVHARCLRIFLECIMFRDFDFCMLQTVPRSLRACSCAVDGILFRVESKKKSGELVVEESMRWPLRIPSCSMPPSAGGLQAGPVSPLTLAEC